MDLIAAAENLAGALHAGKVDKAGEPYIVHLRRVAANLLRRWPDAAPAEVAAAWLHDALEDTAATPESLRAAGMPEETVAIVRAVTRPAGVPYLAWIADLAATGPRGALRVKVADNEDNRDPVRVARLPGAARMVATRYEPARRVLETALS